MSGAFNEWSVAVRMQAVRALGAAISGVSVRKRSAVVSGGAGRSLGDVQEGPKPMAVSGP